MRQYRGMTKDGKWVYGDLTKLYYPKRLCITQEGNNQDWANTRFIKVILESIGQSTGLKDKNGVEIYGGDIVKIKPLFAGTQNGEVVWLKGIAGFGVKSQFGENWTIDGIEEIEVIGNTTEHPELLEK